QHGIARIALLIAEIDPRVEMAQHASRKYCEQKVRRLRLAVGIRHRAWLDRVKRESSVCIGATSAAAWERVVGRRVLVLPIGKAARAIRLPQFQHAVRHRRTVAVEYSPLNADTLARHIRCQQIAGEGIVPFVLAVWCQPIFEEWADGL